MLGSAIAKPQLNTSLLPKAGTGKMPGKGPYWFACSQKGPFWGFLCQLPKECFFELTELIKISLLPLAPFPQFSQLFLSYFLVSRKDWEEPTVHDLKKNGA